MLQPAAGGWALGDLTHSLVPPLLRQVLDARLTSLQPETRAALQVAAVIGQEVTLELWQSVAELHDPDVDRIIGEAI